MERSRVWGVEEGEGGREGEREKERVRVSKKRRE